MSSIDLKVRKAVHKVLRDNVYSKKVKVANGSAMTTRANSSTNSINKP